jgi:hypothetical protein
LIIDVLQGLPGCGKSYRLIEEMASVPGLYLYAVPRIDLSAEKKRDLEVLASQCGMTPVIWEINSGHPKPQSIAKRIEDLPSRHRDEHHVIVIVTHEGLMGANLSGFSDWHARIDEIPNGVSSGKLTVPASISGLTANYDLIPQARGWSHVVASATAPSLPSILKDSLAGPMATIHKNAHRPHGVYFNATNWEDIANNNCELEWFSVWTPMALQAFETIKIAASSYVSSLLHRATTQIHPSQIKIHLTTLPPRHECKCRFLIHYFTASHRGSTKYWSTVVGKDNLRKVARYLFKQNIGYWSGNTLVRERLMYGFDDTVSQEVSPRVEGTNTLKDKTSCAFIYSSKKQDGDQPIMDIFGIDAADIEKAREEEDIFQFVMRGAPRNPEYEGDYHVYLYSEDQVQALAQRLRDHGVTQIEVVPVTDAGIMEHTREHKPRPVKVDEATKIEKRRKNDNERKARKHRAEKEEKIKNGTYRKPGRPRKTAASGDQIHV